MKNPFKNWNLDNAVRESKELFTVIRIENVDYIYFNSVRISTEEDAKGNLLDRLEYLRTNYIEEKMNNL